MAEQFFKGLESDFIAEEDFRFLADAGAGLVLAPFNYRLFLDDQAPGKRKEEGFAAFERLFGLCGKYHLTDMDKTTNKT